MNATQNDVNTLLDEAFEDCECVITATDKYPHGGDRAGYYIAHECLSGFICAEHLRVFVDLIFPDHALLIKDSGHITCAQCRRDFFSVDSYSKVYPL